MSVSNPPEENDRSFVQEYLARGDISGWFDELYSRAGGDEGSVPWAHLAPRPPFARWLDEERVDGAGKTALVIACGLGDDARALETHGFAVTAFDISATAIDWCRKRFPESTIQFLVADMFEPPADWINGFDLVLEVFTVQALPPANREEAVAAIARFVKLNGELLVVAMGLPDAENRSGPPWPLIRNELDLFQMHGLREIHFREFPPPPERAANMWRALYRRVSL